MPLSYEQLTGGPQAPPPEMVAKGTPPEPPGRLPPIVWMFAFLIGGYLLFRYASGS